MRWHPFHLVLFLLFARALNGTTDTWNTATSPADWNTAANWSTAAVPLADNDVVFTDYPESSTSQTITAAGAMVALSLDYEAPGAATISQAGQTLTIGNAGSSTFINVGAASGFTGTLAVDIGTLAINVASLSIQLYGDLTTSAAITESITGAALSLGGDSTLTLSGANTYTGATTINGGSLALSGTSTIADSSALVINNGTFDIASTTSGATIPSLSGPTSGDTAIITLGSKVLTIAQNSDGTFGGIIQGNGSIVVDGTAALTLTGINTYNGDTTVVDGTLALVGSGTIGASPGESILTLTSGSFDISGITNSDLSIANLAGSGTAEIFLGDKLLQIEIANNQPFAGVIQDGGISGGSGGQLEIFADSSSNTFTLSSINTYTGSTKVFTGTLAVTGSISGSTSIIISSGGIVSLGSADGCLNSTAPVTDNGSLDISLGSQTIGALSGSGTVTLGSSTLTTGSTSNTTFSGDISGTGGITKTGGRALTLSGTNDYSGLTTISEGTLLVSGSISNTSAVTNNAVLQFDTTSGSASFSPVISGSGILQKIGSNTLTLVGANLYTGITTVSVGTLSISGSIANSIAVSVASGATLALGATDGCLNTSGVLALLGTLDISLGSQTIGALTGSGDVDLGNQTLTVTIGAAQERVFTGTISDLGSGSFAKAGSGSLFLTGTNTYAGGTTISNGILGVSADANFGSGPLTFNGGTLRTLGTFSSSKSVNLTGTGTISTLTSKTLTLSGDVSGSGALTKSDSGTLVLSGTNDYTGTITVAEGTLSVTGTTSSLTGVNVDSGAVLKGTGIIGGTTVIDGTLSPGSPMGTLTLNNLTLHSDSTTVIEINATESSSLAITGVATLSGPIQIIEDKAIYTLGTEYTILNGSYTGSFGPIVQPYLLRLETSYPTTSTVVLTVTAVPTSITTTGLTGNRLILAKYLNHQSFGTLSTWDNLVFLTGGALDNALDTISPSRNSFTGFVVQNGLLSLNDLVSSRLANHRMMRPLQARSMPLASLANGSVDEDELLANANSKWVLKSKPRLEAQTKPHNVWISGFGDRIDQGASLQNPSFRATTGGVLLGYDYGNFDKGIVGGSLSYFHSDIHEGNGFGSSSLNAVYLSGYGTRYFSQLYVEAALWVGGSVASNRRNVFYTYVDTFSEDAKSTALALQFDPHIELGYDFQMSCFTLEPFLGFDWVWNLAKDFKEHGAAPFNMHQRGWVSSLFRSELGLNGYYTHEFESCYFIARGKVSYMNQQLINVNDVRAGLVGITSVFVVHSLRENQNFISPAIELFVKAKAGGYVSCAYNGEYGSGFKLNEGQLKVGYAF